MSQTIEGSALIKVERIEPWPEPPAAESAATVAASPKRPFMERLLFVGPAIQGLNRRQFEGRLGKLIGSALAHEQEGLPAGSPEYVRLARMADESITLYCKVHLVDRQDLEAQIPAINKLRNLTVVQEPKVPVWLKPSSILGVGLLTVLLAVFLGLDNGLFHATQQFVLHHLTRQ